jgi:hypothetical protein
MADTISGNPAGARVLDLGPNALTPAESREGNFNTADLDSSRTISWGHQVLDWMKRGRLGRLGAATLVLLSVSPSLAACGPDGTPVTGTDHAPVAPGQNAESLMTDNLANVMATASPSEKIAKLNELRDMSVDQINKLSPADQAAWMAYYRSDRMVASLEMQSNIFPISFVDGSFSLNGSEPIGLEATAEMMTMQYRSCIERAAYLYARDGSISERDFKAICGASLSKDSETYATVVALGKKLSPDVATWDRWHSSGVNSGNWFNYKENTVTSKKIGNNILETTLKVVDNTAGTPKEITLTYRWYNTGKVMVGPTNNIANPGGESIISLPLNMADEDEQLMGPSGFLMLAGDPK